MKPSRTMTPAAAPRRLLTRGEAAALLAISPGTLSRWAAERSGPPFVKLGESDKASVRYPADELEAFICARTKHPK
jgi:predicted DNA-binding transcriptional regulator AlpA